MERTLGKKTKLFTLFYRRKLNFQLNIELFIYEGFLMKELQRYGITIERDRITQPAPFAKELNEIEVCRLQCFFILRSTLGTFET